MLVCAGPLQLVDRGERLDAGERRHNYGRQELIAKTKVLLGGRSAEKVV